MSNLPRLKRLAAVGLIVGLSAISFAAPAAASPSAGSISKPTIVLVHGAWADSSSWAPVTTALQAGGYTVLVAPTSMRTLHDDAAAVAAFINQRTTGPVVLVGHSYGGAVITNAATAAPSVKALVYVDAFIPDEGESLGSIVAGSKSALNVDPATVFDVAGYPNAPENDADVYLKAATFAQSFAQDVPSLIRNELAAGQLPITLAALGESSATPAWRSVPSWAFIGTQDRVLPAETQLAEATRAGAKVTQVAAGHLSMISKPLQVVGVIVSAAKSVR